MCKPVLLAYSLADMLFNSLHFLSFFVVVTTLYFTIPHQHRWKLLLGSSCYFYMVFVPVYIVILGATIIIDYFAGIYIEGSRGDRRRWFLIVSILANVGVLSVFKYFNFINENISVVLNQIGYTNTIPNLSILLPVGLSFHTFQAMSYTIEVYKGNQKAERHFGIYALYVMFYPQLVAGPIERPQNILHQFYERHTFDTQRVLNGLVLMLWGLFKKVVIADRLAVCVNFVYDNPSDFTGIPLLLATVCFAFQIYCDFSGYSDMALGAAEVMGFRLMKNFDRPYFSKSIAEFWKRWHISLSTWFRDYVYIPLGGNRVANWRWQFNLLVTFLLSGLWHGANWTYIIWGGLNGLYLISENLTANLRHAILVKTGINKSSQWFKIVSLFYTFSLICISWVFFRAQTVNDAMYIITHFFSDLSSSASVVFSSNMGTDKYNLVVAGFALTALFGIEFLQRGRSVRQLLQMQPAFVRMLVYYVLLLGIVCFGVFDNDRQFIYFQF